MEKIVDYEVVSARPDAFATEVMKKIAQGFEPLGIAIRPSQEGVLFLQAMVKRG